MSTSILCTVGTEGKILQLWRMNLLQLCSLCAVMCFCLCAVMCCSLCAVMCCRLCAVMCCCLCAVMCCCLCAVMCCGLCAVMCCGLCVVMCCCLLWQDLGVFMFTAKELLHLEHNFVWCWTLHSSDCNLIYLASLKCGFGERRIDCARNEVLYRAKEERNILHTTKREKPELIGHICVGNDFWNTLLMLG